MNNRTIDKIDEQDADMTIGDVLDIYYRYFSDEIREERREHKRRLGDRHWASPHGLD